MKSLMREIKLDPAHEGCRLLDMKLVSTANCDFNHNIVIPAYSTLIYDIELVAYYRSNASVPSWKSKTANEWIWE